MLATALTVLTLAASSLAAGPSPRPSQDPFYNIPNNLTLYQPGDIINRRPAPNALAAALDGNASFPTKGLFQLLYRTTDSNGHPTAAVTTLIVPQNGNSSRLLSYQTAYDSADQNCGPSWEIQQYNAADGAEGLELVLIEAALTQGYYVVTADYETPLAQFTAGVVSGQATLDSVRAALKTSSFSGLSAQAKFAFLGYSGGALAGEWAAELQPKYAPELSANLLGFAIGGLTPRVQTVLNAVTKTAAAYLIPAGVSGLASAYPDLRTWLNANLVPSKAADFRRVLNCTTNPTPQQYFANMDLGAYFVGGLQSFNEPAPQAAINAGGIMGKHGLPTAPLYIYKGALDTLSPVNDTDALVKQYCDQGIRSLTYIRNPLTDHILEAVVGAPGAFTFIASLFNGVKPHSGCQTLAVPLNLGNNSAASVFGADTAKALNQTYESSPLKGM